jgi:hypothetical protein
LVSIISTEAKIVESCNYITMRLENLFYYVFQDSRKVLQDFLGNQTGKERRNLRDGEMRYKPPAAATHTIASSRADRGRQ